MTKLNFIDSFLGENKSFWPTSILCWLIFVFGAIIIYLIPDSILENFSSYSFTPTIQNFVTCSTMKLQVAAFFNFMFLYSLLIGLVMSMTVKYSHKNLQSIGLLIYPLILILILVLYLFYTIFEPSCISEHPARSARRLDAMINSPFFLLILGGLFTGGISMFVGMLIISIKFIFLPKEKL